MKKLQDMYHYFQILNIALIQELIYVIYQVLLVNLLPHHVLLKKLKLLIKLMVVHIQTQINLKKQKVVIVIPKINLVLLLF